MAVRPIDRESLLRELTCDFTGAPFHGNRKVTIGEVRRIIESMPTLTPPNEPLTLEELKEMAGEPVYIVEPKKSISSWVLIDEVDEKAMWCVTGIVSCYRKFYKTYGKTWMAYRRPPEGEA